MRNTLILLASCSLLTACQQMNNTHTSPEEVMAELETPEVEGMNSTMLRIAKDAEQQGNFKHAAQTYQQLFDKSPENTHYAIRFGENMRKAGEPAKALSIFHSVLNKSPDNIDALEGKGLSLLSLADTDAAGKALTKVMDKDASRWRTLNAVGILFSTKGLYDEAQQYFDEALINQRNHPAILNNKGLVLALDMEYARALDTLFAASKHARLPIHQIQADLNAALVYAIAGDIKQAEKMAARHLEGPALQNNMGLYALISKDTQLAKTHLHMALSESKTFYEKAWDNLARLDLPRGNNKTPGKRIAIDAKGSSPRNSLGLPIAPNRTYHHPALAEPTPKKPEAETQQAAEKPKKENTPAKVYNELTPSNASTSNEELGPPSPKKHKKASANSGFEALGDFITNW